MKDNFILRYFSQLLISFSSLLAASAVHFPPSAPTAGNTCWVWPVSRPRCSSRGSSSCQSLPGGWWQRGGPRRPGEVFGTFVCSAITCNSIRYFIFVQMCIELYICVKSKIS